jgi:simple sugar transport system permease protein/ribose transport system permease protein
MKKGSLKISVDKILAEHMVWFLLLILVIVGVVVEPVFLTSRNILNILSHAAPTAMMVFGMAFLLMLGRIDLSLESTFALAPILANMIVLRWAPFLPGFMSVLIALAIGLAIGLFNGFLAIKLRVSDFLVGLAMLLFLRGIVKFLIPEGMYNLPVAFTYFGNARFFNGKLSLMIILLALVVAILHFFTRRRPFGRKVLATGSNKEAAFIGGINVAKIQIMAFGLSGLLAAFGGILTAGRQLSCTNGMGEGSIMKVLAAVVLGGIIMTGGKGTIIGALGGAILLQTLENILTLSGVNPFIQDAVFGFILLAAIVFQGIRNQDKKY